MSQYLKIFKTLRGRLILIIGMTIVPTLLLTFFVANQERKSLLEHIKNNAHLLSTIASREHANQIKGARELIIRLSTLADGQINSKIFEDRNFLKVILSGQPSLANIVILSKEGDIIQSAYTSDSFSNLRNNPAFVRAIRSDKVEIGEYLIGPIVNRPVLNLAYAVRDKNGNILYIIFNALDLEWFSQLKQQIRLPSDYSMYIMDRNGSILTELNSREVKSKNNPTDFFKNIIDLPTYYEGKSIKAGENNDLHYVISTPLPDIPGLFVVVGLPYQKLIKKTNFAFYQALGVLSLIILFSTVSILIGSEISILRGIRILSKSARKFGAGDYTARSHIPQQYGELHELSMDFNSMAESLQKNYKELSDAENILRALSQRLQEVREIEAGKIARELHDELGQVLTSVKMQLTGFIRKYSNNETLVETVLQINSQIDDTITFVRKISSDLRPAVLDRLGLVAALEWHISEIRIQTDLAITLNTQGIGPEIDWPVAVALFRISQEAITNVIRHAEARNVKICLEQHDKQLKLVITDDGKGITVNNYDGKSLGIVGMKERAKLVGGEFNLESNPLIGTSITITIS